MLDALAVEPVVAHLHARHRQASNAKGHVGF